MICRDFAACGYLRGHGEERIRRQQVKTDLKISQEEEKQKSLEAKLKTKVQHPVISPSHVAVAASCFLC